MVKKDEEKQIEEDAFFYYYYYEMKPIERDEWGHFNLSKEQLPNT